ncbi:hypothetical protein OsI_11682 [Oryza sativa Indica Group]|uniref:Uncharacterized protein n=1 Tax=Oryza sativa subsp. indica TaxID=39946 RepID=A2XH06_ORYSI|nr:hypothetical protein OsI_11682 [Oryza sativa Indica Group]
MAGYRSRSRSYSPQPRRRYSRSPPRYKRYDDPRDRYPRGGGGGGGGGEGPRRGYGRPPAPTGLLVRNISLTARDHRDDYSPGESLSPHGQDKRHHRSNGRSASPDELERHARQAFEVWSSWIKSWKLELGSMQITTP